MSETTPAPKAKKAKAEVEVEEVVASVAVSLSDEVPEINLKELKEKRIPDLNRVAKELGIEGATNMRKHHQMALPMAQAELKNGKDPQMLQSAKDIIDGQTKEISAFDQWLAAHKPAMDQPMTKGK